MATSRVVAPAYNRALAHASDHSIHNLLVFNLEVIKSLEHHPTDCLGFFRGTAIDPHSIASDVLERALDLKADVIESAMNSQ